MTGTVRYILGPDIPDDEVLLDSQGRVVDDDYVREAVEDFHRRQEVRGRPSLSGSGEPGESPMLRVRLPRELAEAVDEAAKSANTSRSEWVRRALAAQISSAS